MLILCFILGMFSVIPVTAADDGVTTIGNYDYVVLEGKNLEIIKYHGEE